MPVKTKEIKLLTVNSFIQFSIYYEHLQENFTEVKKSYNENPSLQRLSQYHVTNVPISLFKTLMCFWVISLDFLIIIPFPKY